MHLYRDPAAVIFDRAGIVLLQGDPDLAAETCQMLIHGIIQHLVDQMVQPLDPNASYVHARPFPDSLQPLKDRDAVRIVLCLYHMSPPCFNFYFIGYPF